MDALQSGHVGTLLNPRESLSLVVGGGNNISASGQEKRDLVKNKSIGKDLKVE